MDKTKQHTRRWAGKALRDAASSAHFAEAHGVTPRAVRYWFTGDQPSVLSEFVDWLVNVVPSDGLFRIVAHVNSAAKRQVQEKPDRQLVEDFWTLMGTENDRECDENGVKAAPHLDLAAIALAGEREAAVELEIGAHAREIERRGLDPRQVWIEDDGFRVAGRPS